MLYAGETAVIVGEDSGSLSRETDDRLGRIARSRMKGLESTYRFSIETAPSSRRRDGICGMTRG